MPVEQSLPIRWDLVGEDALVQGSDWVRYIALDYANNGVAGVWNTAGYSAYMTVRTDYGAPIVLSLTTENGRLVVGDPDYTVIIALPPSATKNIAPFGRGIYDLFLVPPFEQEKMIYYGDVEMIRRVSP